MLAACNFPAHRTIRDFRAFHLKELSDLFVQVEALLNKARTTDEAEKNEPELDIPAEMARRQDRLNVITRKFKYFQNMGHVARFHTASTAPYRRSG